MPVNIIFSIQKEVEIVLDIFQRSIHQTQDVRPASDIKHRFLGDQGYQLVVIYFSVNHCTSRKEVQKTLFLPSGSAPTLVRALLRLYTRSKSPYNT